MKHADPVRASLPKEAPRCSSCATKVPDRPEWIHEVKQDRYRLIVYREGKRVRLFTRNGHDWTDRYPRVVEAVLGKGPHLLLSSTGSGGVYNGLATLGK